MLRSAIRVKRMSAVVASAVAVLVCWAMPIGAHAALPDSRAYELVSPPDKNGGDIVSDTQRTRAAADGSAVGFGSLGVFAGIQGSGISNEYMAIRASDPNPGTNGWTTHGLFPSMRAMSLGAQFAQLEPMYTGAFSPDMERGILFVWDVLDGNPWVGGAANLYRNDALQSASGTFELVSSCPACESSGTALPGYANVASSINLRPTLAAASPDLSHMAFESEEQLTTDTPAQPVGCDITVQPTNACHVHAYEWNDGVLDLAGRVPVLPATQCDDANGPACVAADVSEAGAGTGVNRNASNNRTPNAISDASDGHVRVFFTQPTNVNGLTSDQSGNDTTINRSFTGRLFMRVDGISTVQLNASERSPADVSAPAEYLGASVDGTRIFFMTTEALTNDAPVNSAHKLYMYDTTEPAGSNLTFISPDGVPSDGYADVQMMIGTSNDGHYVYFTAIGQLVAGRPAIAPGVGMYAWHDGGLAYIGAAPTSVALTEISTNRTNWAETPDQARVTPDGRHLLFSTNRSQALNGYNSGFCADANIACRELFVYNADTGAPPVCVSCDPSGVPATTMATDAVWAHAGAASTNFHLNRAISDDGSRVFFTTGEALVPEDLNGRLDAYEWTAPGTHECGLLNGCLALISTGTGADDSYFMDASSSGNDAFFTTRDQLVGWDRDNNYDLYDARVGGGFPEPANTPVCTGDTCQGTPLSPPALGLPGTSVFSGAGNVSQHLRPRKPPLRCKRGYARKRVKGKLRCVKRKKRHAARHAVAHAKRAQHGQRRGS